MCFLNKCIQVVHMNMTAYKKIYIYDIYIYIYLYIMVLYIMYVL